MIELYINNKKADLGFDVEIALSKSFEGEEEEFSYSFVLPPTKTNCEILSFLNKLNVANKYAYKYTAKLYSNSNLLFDGKLYIDSASDTGFDCNLVAAGNTALEDLFGDEKLKDIRLDDSKWSIMFPKPSDAIILGTDEGDWSEAYHLNKQFLNTKEDPSTLIGWFKPYALYGQPYNIRNTASYNVPKDEQANTQYMKMSGGKLIKGNGRLLRLPFAEQQLLPMFNVKSVIKSAFVDKGYTCKGNFFDSFNDFSYLYESFRGTYKDFIDRDNQRFVVQFTSKNQNSRDFNNEVVDYNPLLNRQSSETPAIKYSNVYLWTADRVTSVESGTPRDPKDTGFMIKIDGDKDIKYVKVLKSGWYKVRMDFQATTTKDSLISRNTAGAPIDFGSLNRNMWELQLAEKDSNRLYSNFLGLDSSIVALNLDNYHPHGSANYMSSSRNTHIQYETGNLDYVIQKPLTTTSRWSVSATLTNLPTLEGTRAAHPIKGDETVYNQFDLIRNRGTFDVEDEDFVCGLRFGNNHWNALEEYSNRPIANRNKYCALMNLPSLEPKEFGITAFNILDNVYKYAGSAPERLELYKLQNNDANFEFGTYGGNTVANLKSSKGYSKNNKYTITGMTPSRDIPASQYDQNNKYDFIFEDILSDYDEGQLNVQMACMPALLNTNVTNANRDNNTAITEVDRMSADNVVNVVWLEEGQELTLKLAVPMLSSGIVDDQEQYSSLNAFIDNVNCSIEYIGTHDEDWKPTNRDNVETYRKSYMHQYFDDTETAEYIEQIADLFRLKVNIDVLSKTVSIDHFDGMYDNIVDITKYVDFGSLSFFDNDKASKIKLLFANNEDYVGGTNGQTAYMTNGNGNVLSKSVKYTKPVMETITVVNKIVQAPIISEEAVYDKIMPNVNRYYGSGSETPTLLYWDNSNITRWNTEWYEESAGKNFSNPKRSYPIMTNQRNGIDLSKPNTIILKFYNIDTENVNISATAYLDFEKYSSITDRTLVKLNDSLYKVKKIDNYDINTGTCELTLTPYM